MAYENVELTTPLTEDDELINEIQARFRVCEEHYGDWQEVAKDDYKFALGDQWTEEEKQQLQSESRPCLTFNRIKPLISLLSGYQRENDARVKVSPEGGEDVVFSEVCDKIIGAMKKWSKMEYKQSYMFDDGITCGKGHLEAIVDYTKDPIRGELKWIDLGPYAIMPDPDCREYDMNEGAEYVFKVGRFSKQKLKSMYPKKKTLIDGFAKDTDDPIVNGAGLLVEGDNDDYGNKPNKTTIIRETDEVYDSGLEQDAKFTLKEYWYKKYVTRYFVIEIDSGEPIKFNKKEEAEEFLSEQGAPDLEIHERVIPEMSVCAYCAGHLLQKETSPFEPNYSGFPFFRFMSEWTPTATTEELRVQGITRQLKDPQKEKNKAKSQYLHILNTQAHSGWVGDENALSPGGWRELKKIGGTPGITIRKKKGYELREIQAKLPAAGFIQREQSADEEFKQISNINPDLLGFQDKTASGRAIALRIRQAVIALVKIFHNLRYTKEIMGKFMLEMIPELFDTRKIIRLLGPQYMRSVKNEQYPQGLTEGHIDAFMQLIKDHKYDVEVTEEGQSKTARFETLENLIELAKTRQEIPIDILIDYMDFPNKADIKQKIQEASQQQFQQAMQLKQMEMQGKMGEIQANTKGDLAVEQVKNKGKVDVEVVRGAMKPKETRR